MAAGVMVVWGTARAHTCSRSSLLSPADMMCCLLHIVETKASPWPARVVCYNRYLVGSHLQRNRLVLLTFASAEKSRQR